MWVYSNKHGARFILPLRSLSLTQIEQHTYQCIRHDVWAHIYTYWILRKSSIRNCPPKTKQKKKHRRKMLNLCYQITIKLTTTATTTTATTTETATLTITKAWYGIIHFKIIALKITIVRWCSCVRVSRTKYGDK